MENIFKDRDVYNEKGEKIEEPIEWGNYFSNEIDISKINWVTINATVID